MFMIAEDLFRQGKDAVGRFVPGCYVSGEEITSQDFFVENNIG